MGFPVEYVASYATPASGNDYRWSRRLRARLRAVIAEVDPDGDRLRRHPPLRGAARRAAAATRPPSGAGGRCGSAGSSRVPLGRAGAFDAVLEPGELAESEDRGPDRRAARPRPPGRPDRAPRPRRAARRASRPRPSSGSTRRDRTCSSRLGQGGEVREATRRALAHLARPRGRCRSRRSRRRSPRPTRSPRGSCALRATYPMSRYFAAFDAAVAAAGYNAYHELIELGVPSLFVPMPRDTDDQPARARWAEGAGLGLGGRRARRPGARGAARPAARPGERDGARGRLARAGAGDRRRRRGRLAATG